MRGLEQFSHLWLFWHFHQTSELGCSPLVKPPRLGGKQKLGVFASRSPFRPNPIGLSVVRNLGSQTINSRLILKVGGIDLVDETPVLDIKPYLAYADAVSQARSGFASDKPGACWDVNFTDSALDALSRYQSTYPNLKAFIFQSFSKTQTGLAGTQRRRQTIWNGTLRPERQMARGRRAFEVLEIRPSERMTNPLLHFERASTSKNADHAIVPFMAGIFVQRFLHPERGNSPLN